LKENIDIEIHAAAEYFLDDHVEGLLQRNEKLLTIKDNWVLSEFSLASAPHGLKDILFEMQMQGYQPVIAHPERYLYLEGNKNFYEELKRHWLFVSVKHTFTHRLLWQIGTGAGTSSYQKRIL
jgi:tyrosine-protein phosphatase YwqE